MTSNDYWDSEAAAAYDDSSAHMFEPEVLDRAVDFLAEIAGSGAALEFAIGTGRVAIPLLERVVAVSGIELSSAMVDELRGKRPDVPIVIGDMATGRIDTYDLTTQQGTSHHYWRQEDGEVRYGASTFRFVWPAECDLMAHLAGMELDCRVADWHGNPFTADSESHISVWRKPS